MIRVNPAPEPADFDSEVRAPGATFLALLPIGSKVNFRYREYWRRILLELHDAYSGVCAYTCHYVPLDTGADTVEHFDPKSKFPNLAYEWTNYRFVSSRMNGRKGDHNDVIDPFNISDETFHLLFPALQIKHNPILAAPYSDAASSTIKRLKLNDERNIRARQEYVVRYCKEKISLDHLADHAPFIYSEIQRQNLSRANLKSLLNL